MPLPERDPHCQPTPATTHRLDNEHDLTTEPTQAQLDRLAVEIIRRLELQGVNLSLCLGYDNTLLATCKLCQSGPLATFTFQRPEFQDEISFISGEVNAFCNAYGIAMQRLYSSLGSKMDGYAVE